MHQVIPVRHLPARNRAASSDSSGPACPISYPAIQADLQPFRNEPVAGQVVRFDVLLKVNVEAIVENGRLSVQSFRPLVPEDLLGGLLPFSSLAGPEESFFSLTRI